MSEELNSIDFNLVEQVLDMVPEQAWPWVKTTIIDLFLSYMPSDILQKLTGKPDDFDAAERILTDYYAPDSARLDLIVHAFEVFGPEETIYALNQWEDTSEMS